MKRTGQLFLVVVLVVLAQVACANPLAAPTATPQSTATPTRTPTVTPSPTATLVPTATPDPCNTREADEWLFRMDAVMIGALEIMLESGLDLEDMEGSFDSFERGARSPELQARAIGVFEEAIREVEDSSPPACLDKAKDYTVQGLEGYLEFWEDLAAGGNFDAATLNLGAAAGSFLLMSEEYDRFCAVKVDSVYCELYLEVQQNLSA
jgi:hypothetical protein